MWPPPQISDPSPPPAAKKVEVAPPPPPNYFADTMKDSMMYTAGLGSIVGQSRFCVVPFLCG